MPDQYDDAGTQDSAPAAWDLEWQANVPAQTFTWSGALAYCEELVLDGDDDWRLPTRREAVSVLDYSRTSNPAFPPSVAMNFWTATPTPAINGVPSTYAWFVSYDWDVTSIIAHHTELAARCVRGTSPSRSPDQLIVHSGTVRNTVTELVWERTTSNQRRTFASALSYCSSLSLAGGGWRLPTVAELMTIVDDERGRPAINVDAFPETAPESFWTSTPSASDPEATQWLVSFNLGEAYAAPTASAEGMVRCVR